VRLSLVLRIWPGQSSRANFSQMGTILFLSLALGKSGGERAAPSRKAGLREIRKRPAIAKRLDCACL